VLEDGMSHAEFRFASTKTNESMYGNAPINEEELIPDEAVEIKQL